MDIKTEAPENGARWAYAFGWDFFRYAVADGEGAERWVGLPVTHQLLSGAPYRELRLEADRLAAEQLPGAVFRHRVTPVRGRDGRYAWCEVPEPGL